MRYCMSWVELHLQSAGARARSLVRRLYLPVPVVACVHAHVCDSNFKKAVEGNLIHFHFRNGYEDHGRPKQRPKQCLPQEAVGPDQ